MQRIAQALVLLVVAAAPAYAGFIVTPEPNTAILLATGVGALGIAAWWRSRNDR